MTSIERSIMKNEEKIKKIMDNPKKYLKVLKAQKTRLLNKQCETEEQFEEVQEKLNYIELQMKMVEVIEKWIIY